MSKTATKKAPTKSEVFRTIAENTELSRKDVQAVFDELTAMISRNLKKTGPQMFTIPGLCKIVVRRIPAKAAEKNKWIPLLKEHRDIAAKPARNVVKVRPLKGLKEMA
jgi:nucleoid DNA-binding protein